MPPTAQTATRKLLELPAELRNTIYRYALCEEDPIEIPRTGLKQPGLIRTCRKIRKETTAIYYAENIFDIQAKGFERYSGERFDRQAHAHVDTVKLDYVVDYFSDNYSWGELMKWLEAYHDGVTATWYLKHDPADPWRPGEPWYVAAKAFEMVKKLKGKLSWSEIADVLETYKDGTMEVMKWVK